MNIFYAATDQIHGDVIELVGQEAMHASRVLRYQEGDDIVVVDGKGGRYLCVVKQATSSVLKAEIEEMEEIKAPKPEKVLGMGLIKKRDRLEFAVEKAVELGISEIVLFRSRHTVKQTVRIDRLEATVLAAMKQSLRAWLPNVQLFDSLGGVMDHYTNHKILLAHKTKDDPVSPTNFTGADKLLILVGPEGGFSQSEIKQAESREGQTISLGNYRLRTETAALTILSRLL